MTKKTEAVVLRSIDYSDHSKIITLYSENLGKIASIVRSKPSLKTTAPSTILIGAIVHIVLNYKQEREIQFISEFKFKNILINIYNSLCKLKYMYYSIEFIMNSTMEEPNSELYGLLKDYLITINKFEGSTSKIAIIFLKFLFDLASRLGFGLSMEKFLWSNRSISEFINKQNNFYYYPLQGKFGLDNSNMSNNIRVSKNATKTLLYLSRQQKFNVQNITLSAKTMDEVECLLVKHLETHLEKKYLRNSKHIFSQLI